MYHNPNSLLKKKATTPSCGHHAPWSQAAGPTSTPRESPFSHPLPSLKGALQLLLNRYG